MTGLIIDNFAGGGGASTGIEAALGRPIDIAINHDPEAVAMHLANHPATRHHCQSVWRADPLEVTGGANVDLAWFSPDCKHFSKAKGGKPVEKHIRDLAWVVVLWAQRVKPAVIMLENVEEFRTWGPLLEDGKPCPAQRGTEYRRWLKELRKAGFKVEDRELRACDYGAPTSRKRLFVIARSDGMPIVWPQPTHGKPGSPEVESGQRQPWRTAASIIDWSIPCPSIFERARPLKDATCRRIAAGIVRFVINAAKPFIVPVCHTKSTNQPQSADDPLRVITTAKGGELAVVAPIFARTAHGEQDASGKKRGKGSHAVDEPFPTVLSSQDSALVAASMVQMGYGEREGQAPRVLDVEAPLGTVVGGGGKHGLVAAFLEKFSENSRGRPADAPIDTVMAGATRHAVVAAHMAQHNGGRVGRAANEPLQTITHRGTQTQLVASSMVKLRGTSKDGQPSDEPLHTVSAGGMHHAEVRAFLTKYYGSAEHGQDADTPLDSATSKARFGLVTVDIDGEPFVIADIGMRMLSPRELFGAQGFPPDYIIDPLVADKRGQMKQLTKTAQIRMCGNSVCPPVAEALVRANVAAVAIEIEAA